MSADNYWEVQKHPNGGFTYVMGFESQNHARRANVNDPQFNDVWAAWNAANDDDWTEYGVSFNVDCIGALRDAV